MKRVLTFGLILFLLALIVGFMLGWYMLPDIGLILIWGIAGMGMVILVGFSGQLSLGHSAFMAIGAYSMAMITSNFGGSVLMMILGALVGIAVAIFFALFIGLPALRLKGYYLAIATIAFGVGMEQLIRGTDALGGAIGIRGLPTLFYGMGSYEYILSFLVVLVAFLAMYAIGIVILKSPYGVMFNMVRDSEVAARSYGNNISRNKLLAFIISAIYGSLAGGLYAVTQNIIVPTSFGLLAAINLLVMIIIGGAIMLEGGLVGALIIIGIPIFIEPPAGTLTLINGVLLILFVLLLPNGIAFEVFALWHKKFQGPYIRFKRFLYTLRPCPGKRVEVAPGTRMYYVEKGEGKPLLYIHGNFASQRWFSEIMDVPGYRAIAPDLVNFGRSDRASESDIDVYADYVAAFIDELELGSCYVVGQSLGGAVAISLALRYPQKVNRMLLLDSSPINGVQVPEVMYPLIDQTKGNYNLLKGAVARIMGTRSSDIKMVNRLTKEGLLMNTDSFVGNARALAKFDYSAKAGSNKIPTLAIVGELDPLVSVADCEQTAKALNGTSKVIPNIGHALNIEDPEQFLQILTSFDSE